MKQTELNIVDIAKELLDTAKILDEHQGLLEYCELTPNEIKEARRVVKSSKAQLKEQCKLLLKSL